MHPRTQLVAALVALSVMSVMLLSPRTSQTLAADNVVMLPEGGRLDALDERGQAIGPCPLEHTEVTVDISGHLTRVTARQTYENPYDQKIEAVYTFPLSHRGAVDRMTMTIGDRVVEGEVKEREQARRIYQAARDDGYVASLLEQERPNIFTQSVANIEPGERIVIEISYVETVESVDGAYRFAFPTVVAPRYIPGRPTDPTVALPEGLQPRRGVILQGPAELEADGSLGADRLGFLLHRAVGIQPPGEGWRERPGGDNADADAGEANRLHRFTATYATGARETGELFDDGTGHVNGRWFYFDVDALRRGGGFAPDTDQVPDASRITPMPVRPETRAGHDISITVNIDTGGPGIEQIETPQHRVTQRVVEAGEDDKPRRVTLTLENEGEIPNRDFLLTWRQTGDLVNEATFTHTGDYGAWSGGFFTLMLQPPDRVADEDARERELIFVLDQSGSMTGARLADRSALDAAKDVIRQSIDTMRPNDRFNIISFQSTLDVLWDEPQANTAENRRRAQQYIDQRQGGGGTEMRNAVLKALQADGPDGRRDRPVRPRDLLNEPADGREVRLRVPADQIREGGRRTHHVRVADGLMLHLDLSDRLARNLPGGDVDLHLRGTWQTRDGDRVLRVERVELVDDHADDGPMRIVLFVTDGLVGNDDAIIHAIREHADRTRVFTIGMSRSPNRHLLDTMARVGRGAADYVLPDQEVDPIVQRFADRIATPVLTDIELEFSDGLEVFDVIPTGDLLPDLYDVQPLVIHGRYAEAGEGTLTIRGRTGRGAYERTLDLTLPEQQPAHDVIATLWARSMIDELTRAGSREGIVALGETFGIVSEHTSFVAVEKSRVTVGGRPMLVRVPIEFPEGMSWEGIFGPDRPVPRPADDRPDIEEGDDEETILARREGEEQALGLTGRQSEVPTLSKYAAEAYFGDGSYRPGQDSFAEPSRPAQRRGRGGGGGGGSGGGLFQADAQPAAPGESAALADDPGETAAAASRPGRPASQVERERQSRDAGLFAERQLGERQLAERRRSIDTVAPGQAGRQRSSRPAARADRPAAALRAEPEAAQAPDVEDVDADGRRPLDLDLPNPVFAGTPQDIPPGVRMEPPTGQPREPHMAAPGLSNVALHKPVTASDDLPLIGSLDLITNGDKEALDGRFVELAPGPQWVQIDLEGQYEIHAILLWLNHLEPRVYHGVVVQASNDPDFEEGVVTLFNNDHENRVGQGVGEDFQYFESFEGKLIEADAVVARYVRVHTHGSTMDDQNHYTEVEVWAREPRDADAAPADRAGETEAAEHPDEPADPVAEALGRSADELDTLARRVEAPLLVRLAVEAPEDWPDRRLLASVRLSDLEAGTRELEQAGFRIEDTVARGNFVVGYLTLDQLDTIALLDAVRRVEQVPAPPQAAAD